MRRRQMGVRDLGSLAFVLAFAGFGCGGGGSAPPPIDGSDQPDGGGGSDAGDDAGPALSHCPTDDVNGPAMTRVRWNEGIAFCIDSTEVTNAQYAEFLAAPDKTSNAETPPRCGWNASLQPADKATNGPPCPTFDPVGRASHPVVCVDWCDAAAYCRWAGKRLCERPQDNGGGPVGDWTVANASEWVIACTGDHAKDHPYSYGMTVEPGRCVDQQYPSPTPSLRPVKDAAMCEGGVPGLFDMSGNAGEWQNDCVAKTGDSQGDTDVCHPLGGSFAGAPSDSACTADAPLLRNQLAGDIGFRCCSDSEF